MRSWGGRWWGEPQRRRQRADDPRVAPGRWRPLAHGRSWGRWRRCGHRRRRRLRCERRSACCVRADGSFGLRAWWVSDGDGLWLRSWRAPRRTVRGPVRRCAAVCATAPRVPSALDGTPSQKHLPRDRGAAERRRSCAPGPAPADRTASRARPSRAERTPRRPRGRGRSLAPSRCDPRAPRHREDHQILRSSASSRRSSSGESLSRHASSSKRCPQVWPMCASARQATDQPLP